VTEEIRPEWMIYQGKSKPTEELIQFPPAPPWRTFTDHKERRGTTFRASEEQIRMVNAALYLRRPLLITGKPGVGKSSLAYSVAEELQLGTVLRWSITSRSTLAEGLYRYDAIGRMQEVQINRRKVPDIGKYITLGPLGTALTPRHNPEPQPDKSEAEPDKPRVLLIDEIDKSDLDLPNDLLNIFEEGEFEIPELARIPDEQQPVAVRLYQSEETKEIYQGKVRCANFPFVVMTSNGERDFPAPFLRRCLRLRIEPPSVWELKDIVNAHLEGYIASLKKGKDEGLAKQVDDSINQLVTEFVTRRDTKNEVLANDQLLNAVFLLTHDLGADNATREALQEAILRPLENKDS
jgi:MoxR-like ATPase